MGRKAPTTLSLDGLCWQPGPRLTQAPAHSFLCLFTRGTVTCPAEASTSCPCLSQALPTPQQNVTQGPRDTRQLAVASGTNKVPHLQTRRPRRTLFPQFCSWYWYSSFSQGTPIPQKGYSPPKGAGPSQCQPPQPRVPNSRATSPVPGRAVKPHFSCWDEQQDKVKQQKQGLPWWSSSKESALQGRGHRFDPWSGN